MAAKDSARGPDGPAGITYWESIAANEDGMLGGFASVSRIDLQGSRTFLARLGIGTKLDRQRVSCAMDAGAGCVEKPVCPLPCTPVLAI
jgi:hypothetical protein